MAGAQWGRGQGDGSMIVYKAYSMIAYKVHRHDINSVVMKIAI